MRAMTGQQEGEVRGNGREWQVGGAREADVSSPVYILLLVPALSYRSQYKEK